MNHDLSTHSLLHPIKRRRRHVPHLPFHRLLLLNTATSPRPFSPSPLPSPPPPPPSLPLPPLPPYQYHPIMNKQQKDNISVRFINNAITEEIKITYHVLRRLTLFRYAAALPPSPPPPLPPPPLPPPPPFLLLHCFHLRLIFCMIR